LYNYYIFKSKSQTKESDGNEKKKKEKKMSFGVIDGQTFPVQILQTICHVECLSKKSQ